MQSGSGQQSDTRGPINIPFIINDPLLNQCWQTAKKDVCDAVSLSLHAKSKRTSSPCNSRPVKIMKLQHHFRFFIKSLKRCMTSWYTLVHPSDTHPYPHSSVCVMLPPLRRGGTRCSRLARCTWPDVQQGLWGYDCMSLVTLLIQPAG